MFHTCSSSLQIVSAGASGLDDTVRQRPASQTCTDSPQWAAYTASLGRNGYFRGNIPGSAQYKQLLAQAEQSFTQLDAHKQSAADAASPAEAILAILEQPVDVQALQVCLSQCCIWLKDLCLAIQHASEGIVHWLGHDVKCSASIVQVQHIPSVGHAC